MNDQYNEALSREEEQRIAYWECVEEDREEDREEENNDDAQLTASQLQWIYDHC
jgi:hypothetical protein